MRSSPTDYWQEKTKARCSQSAFQDFSFLSTLEGLKQGGGEKSGAPKKPSNEQDRTYEIIILTKLASPLT